MRCAHADLQRCVWKPQWHMPRARPAHGRWEQRCALRACPSRDGGFRLGVDDWMELASAAGRPNCECGPDFWTCQCSLLLHAT